MAPSLPVSYFRAQAFCARDFPLLSLEVLAPVAGGASIRDTVRALLTSSCGRCLGP